MPAEPDVRLIQWTGERTPPAGLLARLRAIHAQAELVDAGAQWWLGVVEPNPYRQRTALRILARTDREAVPDLDTVRLGQLMLQGFSLVAKYDQADDVMVEDFRRRCWLHDHDPAANDLYRELRRAVAQRKTTEEEKAEWDTVIRERANDAIALWQHRPQVSVPAAIPTEEQS